MFVNAEQVSGPTAELTELYESRWAAECLALGATHDELADAIERRTHDRCACVEPQLDWLRDAGFAWADCFYKQWGFAVICARRGS
jgi:tRNA (cmo5U34)-methyltransferase